MLVLLFFAFISGIVTILSPCILPILPLLLTGTVGQSNNKAKPLGIITGFVASFTIFTVLLSTIVRAFHFNPEFIRIFAVMVIFMFGLSLILPAVQQKIEILFSLLSSKISTKSVNKSHGAYYEGILIGISLGILWSPCVGPILASVIALAVTGTVSFESFFIVLAYALGTAIPMFLIMTGGRNLLARFPGITNNTSRIQKGFGVFMILTALLIATGNDRNFQTFVLTHFPKYGSGLTKIEDNTTVRKVLESLRDDKGSESKLDLSKTDETQESNFDENLPKYALAPELRPSGKWFNSEPLKMQELRGKVVLLDIWTYSCINCQRTLPYIRTWWDKYKDKGLVIIGIHSPEFEFEKDPDNVQQAITDFNLSYPIFQDNDFETWRAYSNQYWPAKYIVDKDGYIRYYHFGEGNYAETERVIQTLLKEAGKTDVSTDVTTQTYDINAKTPETYIGFYRSTQLASPEIVQKDKFTQYNSPVNLPSNKYALEGEWLVSGEYALPNAGSKLNLNFDAENVYLVLKPHTDKNVQVKVFVDGKVQYFGDDNHEGIVTVDKAALYKMVKIPGGGRHMLKLEFIDGNVEVFAFTFG